MGNKSKQIKFRDWGGAGCRFQNRNQREFSWINVSTNIFPNIFFFREIRIGAEGAVVDKIGISAKNYIWKNKKKESRKLSQNLPNKNKKNTFLN